MFKGENAVKLNIPRKVLNGAKIGSRVRMASILFRNNIMSGLLPESLNDGAQNDMLVNNQSLVPRPIPNF